MCEKIRTGVYGGGSGSSMLSVKQLFFIWTSCSFEKNKKIEKFQHLFIYSTTSFLVCIARLWKLPWQHKDSLSRTNAFCVWSLWMELIPCSRSQVTTKGLTLHHNVFYLDADQEPKLKTSSYADRCPTFPKLTRVFFSLLWKIHRKKKNRVMQTHSDDFFNKWMWYLFCTIEYLQSLVQL